MRPRIALVSVALLGSLMAPAFADHLPAEPDYNLVDGTPVCGTAGTGAPATLAAGTIPSVGTYNILHSQGENDDADVSDRFDQVVDAIETGDADVWGLQEVTNNEEHGNVAQRIAAELSSRTGEAWDWCWSLSNPRFPGEPDVLPEGGGPMSALTAQFSNLPEGSLSNFREGLAVVTRLDITSAQFRRLQPRALEAASCPLSPNPLSLIGCQFPAVFDSRQVLHARIDAGPAGQLDLFNTHIAHGLTNHSDETKKRHIEKALDIIDEWASDDALPDVFTGDFNSSPSTDRHQLVEDAGFTDTWLAANGESSAGWTSSQQELTSTNQTTVGSRIDYVWERPGSCGLDPDGFGSVVIGTNAEQIPDGRWRWPSDHLGVASTSACAS